MDFGGRGLIRGVDFGGRGLIRGVDFGGRGLIKEWTLVGEALPSRGVDLVGGASYNAFPSKDTPLGGRGLIRGVDPLVGGAL